MSESKVSLKDRVQLRAVAIFGSNPSLSAKDVANIIDDEFPELAWRTIYDYCKPGALPHNTTNLNDREREYVFHEETKDYFYNELNDVYMVFSPHRTKPINMPGDTHRIILKEYSRMGAGATIEEMCTTFGFERVEMMWYLKAFQHTHASVPFSREEIEESINNESKEDQLVHRGYMLQKGKLTKAIKKKQWRETLKQAELGRNLEEQFERITLAIETAFYQPLELEKYLHEAPSDDDLLDIIPIYDRHVGKLPDNDPEDILETLVEMSILSRAKHAMLVLGGDYFNYDTPSKGTTRGTRQDATGNPEDIVPAGWAEAIRLIRVFSALYETLQVVVLPGNHDEMSMIHLNAGITQMCDMGVFDNVGCKVSMLSDGGPMVVTNWGNTLLAFEHGDGPNHQRFMSHLTTNHRELWGQTKWTHAFTGHLHHAYENDKMGGIIAQQPSAAKPDRWHKKNGWTMSTLSLRLYTFDKTRGFFNMANRNEMR